MANFGTATTVPAQPVARLLTTPQTSERLMQLRTSVSSFDWSHVEEVGVRREHRTRCQGQRRAPVTG